MIDDNLNGIDDLFDTAEIDVPEIDDLEIAAETSSYTPAYKAPAATAQDARPANDQDSAQLATANEYSEPARTKIAPKKSAETLIAMFDQLSSMGLSAYSGRNRKEYKLTRDEKNELIEPLTEWLEISTLEVHPGIACFTALLFVVGAKGMEAHEHKKDDEKEQEFQRMKREAELRKAAAVATEVLNNRYQAEPPQERPQATTFEETAASIPPAPTREKRTNRMQYQIDAENFYEKTEDGVYIQKEDRTEKPTKGELNIINRLKAEGLSQGKINAQLRKYNKIG